MSPDFPVSHMKHCASKQTSVFTVSCFVTFCFGTLPTLLSLLFNLNVDIIGLFIFFAELNIHSNNVCWKNTKSVLVNIFSFCNVLIIANYSLLNKAFNDIGTVSFSFYNISKFQIDSLTCKTCFLRDPLTENCLHQFDLSFY